MARHVLLIVVSLASAASAVHAQTLPRLGIFNSGNGCPDLRCYPDDYCRKPIPCLVPVSRCGGPDDYCRKPIPCLFDVPRAGLCPDYCRKAFPSLLCPPCFHEPRTK
jgi:hypothetical protein